MQVFIKISRNMKIGNIISFLVLVIIILSCDFSNGKSHDYQEEHLDSDSTISDNQELKNYFVPYGKDSLLMIPDWTLANLYESPLEPYHKLYKSYQDFERAFLYHPKNLSKRIKWSYHIRVNEQILWDYSQMSFENFSKKYTMVEGNDTVSLLNDTTLAYCFDKHGYYCIFNYQNKGKTKIIKTRSHDDNN